MKNIGPTTEPCGIPKETSAGLELRSFTDTLSPTSKVRLKPRKSGARNAVERAKCVQENIVVDSIESRREIEKGQDSHMIIIKSTQNFVSYFEYRRLSTVT